MAASREEALRPLQQAVVQYIRGLNISDELVTRQLRDVKQLTCTFDRNKPALAVNDSMFVKIFNIRALNHFYITNTQDLQELESLQSVLQIIQPNKSKLFIPDKDFLCAGCVAGVWYRARVERSYPNETAKIRLIDFGRDVVVTWPQLSVLERCLARFPPFAIKCKLPNYNTNVDIPTQKFQQICVESTKCRVVFDAYDEDGFWTVTLLVGTNANDLVCIDRPLLGLVEGNGINGRASSTGAETVDADGAAGPLVLDDKEDQIQPSPESSPQKAKATLSHTEKPLHSRRIFVKMIHFVSPDEFYVCLKKHLNTRQTMHRNIQKICWELNNDNLVERNKWRVKDGCYLEAELPGRITQWYRGSILQITEDHFKVFLMDVGATVEADGNRIYPIDPDIEVYRSSVIQCRLACIKPSDSTWDPKFKDTIDALVKEFKELAASIQSKGDSKPMPVVLWGGTRHCNALAPDYIDWINLNERLYSEGLAVLDDEFIPVADDQEEQSEFTENLMATLQLDSPKKGSAAEIDDEWYCDITEPKKYVISEEVAKVKAWLPSEPISKGLFNCIPMYVDRNCRIYVLDDYRRWISRQMRNAIHIRMAKVGDEPIYTAWQKGEACLAKYHADEMYYRAEVLRVKKDNQCVVRFIDYRNCETVSFDDMRQADILGSVPALVRPYRLAGVQPISEDYKWPRDVIDFIHGLVVDQLGSLRIIQAGSYDDDEPECSISFAKTADLAQFLIHSEKAKSKPN